MKVLINASNLHNGGGIQVAISFLYELSIMTDLDLSHIDIVASDEVNTGLTRLSVALDRFGDYKVINTYGLQALRSKLNRRIKSYDAVFTIFGPNYLRVKAKKDIVGFAQPWIIDFENPISQKLSFLSRNKLLIKFNLQWLFFRRSDHYVVELEHVKNKLHIIKKVPHEKISVVYNTVSSLYTNHTQWNNIVIKKSDEQIALGIVTRDYPHKNLDILPEVVQAIKKKHGLTVRFYTTLNDEEWSKKSAFFKRHVSTVGSLSPEQCPSFYQQIDGVIFPSLLECFSATPLEAMVMEKPLFASDLGFVRDVCHNYAIYINPLDANNIAFKIAEYFQSDNIDHAQLKKAKEYALNFSSAKNRAESYLKIINNYL